jgi:thiamine kinase-like enzyme
MKKEQERLVENIKRVSNKLLDWNKYSRDEVHRMRQKLSRWQKELQKVNFYLKELGEV